MQMRAAVLVKPGHFEVREVARPEPGPDEVLVRVMRTGICGTDLHIFHGHYASEWLPMIPGHEFTGYVAGLGAGVTWLEEGVPVVVDTNIGCTRCYWCRRNQILNCPDMRQMGISMDGGFADYIAVPARLVIPAPDVPYEVLALAEPLSCVVRAARASGVTFGQSALVIGAGPIGNLHVQLLRTLGAAPILVTDLSADRVAQAVSCGADIGVSDPAKLRETVMEATQGRGTDLVIESVGNAALYAQAQTLMRKGGHLAVFGLTGPGETLDLEILSTVLDENSFAGSVAGIGEDLHDALTLLTHGRIQTAPFTQAAYGLEQIQEAFESYMDRPQDLKTQIVMES